MTDRPEGADWDPAWSSAEFRPSGARIFADDGTELFRCGFNGDVVRGDPVAPRARVAWDDKADTFDLAAANPDIVRGEMVSIRFDTERGVWVLDADAPS